MLKKGYALLYDVKAGQRNGKQGYYHHCLAPGCGHLPFFVSTKGNKRNCWEHVEREHADFMASKGVKLRSEPAATAEGGAPANEMLNFDEMFGHNLNLVKYLQSTGQTLSQGENPELRRFVKGLNPRAKTACYEKMVEIQHAQRVTQQVERMCDFAQAREDGMLLGAQFDFWSKHGRKWGSFNYTYLELGQVDVLVGFEVQKVDRYFVRSSVLDFVEFPMAATAVNMKAWLDSTVAANGLTWADFNLLVPDGASSCVAVLEMQHDLVDSEVCYCHAVARAVLTSIGMGAAVPDEHKSAIAELTTALKKMRTLATKFHRNGKLAAALHISQAADGVVKELQTIKAAITRWNGVYIGTQRNLQLKAHIEHALSQTNTVDVYVENADGEEEVVAMAVGSIRPSPLEWVLVAEAAAVLEKPYLLTQVLQGMQTPPEDGFMAMVRVHGELTAAATTTYKIPAPPAPGSGSTALVYVDRPYAELQPAIKVMIALLADQLFNRLLSAGPTKTSLIAMKSNPYMAWPPAFLTPSQVASAETHYLTALHAAQAAIDAAQQQSPAQPGVPVNAAAPQEGAVVAPVAVPSSGTFLTGYYDPIEEDDDEEEEAEDSTSPLFVEGVNWDEMKRKRMKSALYAKGVITRVTSGAQEYVTHGRTMDVRTFWANKDVQSAFPARHRVFCGVAAAINHESNSEGTFSFAGRAYNKHRTTLKPEQFCDTVVAASGEKRKATSSDAVSATYKRLREEGVAVAPAAPAADIVLGGAV